MSSAEQRRLLITLFINLRRSGFDLGVGELLAAQRALEGGWGAGDTEALGRMARLLWCHSPDELREFETVWDSSVAYGAPAKLPELGAEPGRDADERQEGPPDAPPEEQSDTPEAEAALATLPISVPELSAGGWGADLQTYWPVSRRFMLYAWRYLRRPVADGPADVMDIYTTVERAARQGFYLSPVFRRRERNDAHLILLVDQGGSMAPFHHLTRDLVRTALHESSIRRVEVFYFHDVWSSDLYQDPHRTLLVPAEAALGECWNDTSVLVVSDGGAARGRRESGRVRDTAGFLHRLKHYTSLLAWLNPMPVDRWADTSAQTVSHLVPMFQMDPDGFSSAVDVLRGQPFQHYR